MAWEHWEAWSHGSATVIDRHHAAQCSFELGEITTGRSRVFKSLYVLIVLPNGIRVTSDDRHSLVTALKSLAIVVGGHGYRLLAAGLDDRFFETGLSHNTGLGYIEPHKEPFHILDVPW